jgi:aminoglycoside 6'-N-acetyltransferase I
MIRRATKDDLAGWLALRRLLWPDQPERLIQGEVVPMYTSPTEFALLAFVPEAGDTPVGLIEINVRDQAPGSDYQPIPYVEAWYVLPEVRQRGIGRALLEAAEAWARAAGFSAMASDTTDDYPLSPTAHAALGFHVVEVEYHFFKRL